MDTQLCEYSENHWSGRLKWVNLWYVNYISIKMFKDFVEYLLCARPTWNDSDVPVPAMPHCEANGNNREKSAGSTALEAWGATAAQPLWTHSRSPPHPTATSEMSGSSSPGPWLQVTQSIPGCGYHHLQHTLEGWLIKENRQGVSSAAWPRLQPTKNGRTEQGRCPRAYLIGCFLGDLPKSYFNLDGVTLKKKPRNMLRENKEDIKWKV